MVKKRNNNIISTLSEQITRNYLSIRGEQTRRIEFEQEQRGVEGGVVQKRADSKLSRRFGTVRFVYRSGMAGERARGRKENGTASPSKCMRTLGDNANARSPPFLFVPPKGPTLALFLPVGINPCRCGLELRLRVEVNSRVHLHDG